MHPWRRWMTPCEKNSRMFSAHTDCQGPVSGGPGQSENDYENWWRPASPRRQLHRCAGAEATFGRRIGAVHIHIADARTRWSAHALCNKAFHVLGRTGDKCFHRTVAAVAYPPVQLELARLVHGKKSIPYALYGPLDPQT